MDDRSVGYERGSTVSKAWDRAVTEAAIEVAGYVRGHLKELAGSGDNGPYDEKNFATSAHASPNGPSVDRFPLRSNSSM